VIVLRPSAILHCDRCEALVVGSERGWRGYVQRGADGRALRVEIVCPGCAERLFGEDEARVEIEIEIRRARRT
jgi:hypothetical protein